MTSVGDERPSWTFLTNHAHVLLCIAADPGIRGRDIAARVGITERAAQRIIADLEEAGYLSHVRVGRRNRYAVQPDAHLRHPMDAGRSVTQLIALLDGPAAGHPRREEHG